MKQPISAIFLMTVLLPLASRAAEIQQPDRAAFTHGQEPVGQEYMQPLWDELSDR